jgi:DegV family protein with EDD domain
MSVKIVTDSTCDLPQEVIQELDIRVVPLYINIGEKGFLDGIDISRQEFYKSLPDYTTHPTTGTPGIETFLNIFNELENSGASDILTIHISESLSATVNIARSAAQQYMGKTKVTVLDSKQLSLGTGFQVELAGRMAQAGHTLTQIMQALKGLASRSFVAAGLDTLEFLRRSGRMNRFVTGIGSLLQLKPILTMENGQPGSKRVRTAEKAHKTLVKLLEEHLPIERFALLHTNAAQEAEAFKQKIAHLLPEGQVYSMDITPVIGAHIGPGAVGYAIISKRSQ